jgi:hypothetical protein
MMEVRVGEGCSEEAELLLSTEDFSLGIDLHDVESDGLGEGSALADCDDVTISHTEGGGDVGGEVLVSLLEPVVLLDVMQVVSSDHEGSLHLGRNDDSPIHIIIINIY